MDAPVEPVQQAALDPSLDRVWAQSRIQELRPRDDPVLPLRDHGHPLVGAHNHAAVRSGASMRPVGARPPG